MGKRVHPNPRPSRLAEKFVQSGPQYISFEKKCPKSKPDTTLCTQKPAATPTFCKRNVSRMNHIEMVN